jgi:hypothetical protein
MRSTSLSLSLGLALSCLGSAHAQDFHGLTLNADQATRVFAVASMAAMACPGLSLNEAKVKAILDRAGVTGDKSVDMDVVVATTEGWCEKYADDPGYLCRAARDPGLPIRLMLDGAGQ